MYAILNFSAGWQAIAELDRIAKSINALVTGSSLASLQSGVLASSTTYKAAKSTRVASALSDFWIRDTDYISHSPCDTAYPKSKYLRFSQQSSHIYWNLANDIAFTTPVTNTVYNSNVGTNTAPLNVHVYCNSSCVVVGFVQENDLKPLMFSIVSEFTYDAMPYYDENNSFIPAIMSNLLGYTPQIVGTGSATQNPFSTLGFVSNYTTGSGSGIVQVANWRVGNTHSAIQPTQLSVGNSRLDPEKLTEVEAFLPIGFAATSSTGLFVGNITDKTGIYIMSGPGYPDSANRRAISPDIVIAIDGTNYIVLDKFIIPFV